ncbi:TetR/AcrR family transcriptional regulator [Kribbella sandramycini]|uniref:AcrR family transcriptional regulator n=1 Tax=Kribbella sandramycini TaxID=60450 RepID=A0A7Y4KW05_9ACTN|nr:TetR/AcrR family transcriptional regulator [Kribbella sandramycini]MBB6567686.1 AcrR family transcriptional regulator [Kribbella sandramycini]NOL39713.1 TetR/AcrR family transcriptional regulator [Kribbella sandramycini]
MASKRDWLDAGLTILTEEGVPALTIERLVGMLGLTKGSFYHHFGSMPGYKTALLDLYEQEFTSRFVEAVDDARAAPRARLDALMNLVVNDRRADPEVAIRAWAMQDAEVGEVQRRIDNTRMKYLRDQWQQHTGDATEAKLMSQLIYLSLIGATHAVPPIKGKALRRLFEFAMNEIPARQPKTS